MKQFAGKNQVVLVIVLVLVGAFLYWHPEKIRKNITAKYTKELAASAGSLNEKQKQKVLDTLEGLKQGRMIVRKKGKVENYIFQDFFSEPWRIWANSFYIWARAREYFTVLCLLLIGKTVYDENKKRNLRKKAVK